MMRVFWSLLVALLSVVAFATEGWASGILGYQPPVPKGLKK